MATRQALTEGFAYILFDYDARGELIKKTTPFATVDLHYNASLPTSIITHLQDHTHTESLNWSPSGKLSSHNTKNFSYTPQGFLATAGEEHFSFNPLGIRNSANHTSIPHDGIDAFGKIITELIDSKQIKSTYDALGQTISSGDTSFEWDPWGRLKPKSPTQTPLGKPLMIPLVDIRPSHCPSNDLLSSYLCPISYLARKAARPDRPHPFRRPSLQPLYRPFPITRPHQLSHPPQPLLLHQRRPHQFPRPNRSV